MPLIEQLGYSRSPYRALWLAFRASANDNRLSEIFLMVDFVTFTFVAFLVGSHVIKADDVVVCMDAAYVLYWF